MAVPSTPLFGNPTRVTADAAIKASPGKIWALMMEGGTDASSMDFHDDTDGTDGDPVIGITAPCTTDTTSGQSTVFVSFVELGGIDFAAGIYCNWTGSAAVGYVWFG